MNNQCQGKEQLAPDHPLGNKPCVSREISLSLNQFIKYEIP